MDSKEDNNNYLKVAIAVLPALTTDPSRTNNFDTDGIYNSASDPITISPSN